VHLPKLYDPSRHDARVRYAIATILRDRLANEGGFNNCFEMEDRDDVIFTILRRGLRNPGLRAALESSHLINWLAPYPELSEAYHRIHSDGVAAAGRRKYPGKDKREGQDRGSGSQGLDSNEYSQVGLGC
jgi:hypothetical protein